MATISRPPFLTRPFALLVTFYFLVFVAGYQLLPVAPLHLRDLGASLAESGRFTTCFTLGSGLGALFTGALGDRLGQRRVLVGASALSVLFLATYAFLPVAWAFYPLAFFHGLVWSGLRTASVAKAGHLLTPEHRAEGLTLFGLAAPGGLAVGPLLGLTLLPLLHFRGLTLMLALVFLGLLLVARAFPPEPPAAIDDGPLLRAPEPGLAVPVVILLLLGISYGPMPPFAAQEAKAAALAWPSALLTSQALGMVGMRFLMGTRGMGHNPLRLLKPMLALTMLGMVLLAVLPFGTPRHILGGALYGGGFGISHTLIFMAVMAMGDPARRGASVGLLYVSYDAGQAIGALLVGQTMEAAGHAWGPALGYRVGWGLAALGLAVTVPLAARLVKRHAH